MRRLCREKSRILSEIAPFVCHDLAIVLVFSVQPELSLSLKLFRDLSFDVNLFPILSFLSNKQDCAHIPVGAVTVAHHISIHRFSGQLRTIFNQYIASPDNYTMLSIFFALAISSLFLIQKFELYIRRRSFAKQHNCQPVPRLEQKDRLLGLDTLFKSYAAFQSDTYLQLSQKRFERTGNTFSFRSLGRTELNTCDPENIKAILSGKFRDFAMGPTRKSAFEPLIGHGIFTADGPHWEKARKIIKPSFAHGDIKDLSIFEGHVQELLQRLPRDQKTPVDLAQVFSDFTIEMAAEFLFGGSESSATSSVSPAEFAAAFDRGQKTVTRNFVLGPLANLIPNPEFKADCQTVQSFVAPYVTKALRSSHSDQTQPQNFLTSMAQQTRDPDLLTGALLNTLLAGRDTTASLLTNLFFILSRDARILNKLQAELTAAKITGPPTLSQIKDLSYLQNCINESLRLHPPIPRNSRTAIRDTVLPRGGGPDGQSPIFVPAGTQVGYAIYATHRLESIYGADAAEFRPERWESKDLKPGWAYLPFNGGPRICLGQRFALNEVSYVVVRMLQELEDVKAVEMGEEWVEGLGLTCSSKNGAVVRVQRREGLDV